jgi:hypothetical protein
MTFWRPFWCFFVRSSVAALTFRHSHFRPVYWYYRPPEHGGSPAGLWSAVRCGARQHSYQFLVPGCIECGGRRVPSRASLFLSKAILPHCSGWIPETAALYYTSARYRERWVYTSWKRGQNWTDPGSKRSSQTRLI